MFCISRPPLTIQSNQKYNLMQDFQPKMKMNQGSKENCLKIHKNSNQEFYFRIMNQDKQLELRILQNRPIRKWSFYQSKKSRKRIGARHHFIQFVFVTEDGNLDK